MSERIVDIKTEKSDVVENIKKIIIGANDMAGNKIINVLARHNEYVIYEIETDDINNRMKVLIDGHTDESEAKIQKRFNEVKQKYIEAKGMLTKSSNFEMMKHRIAHTLSTALNSDEDGKAEFTELIETITKEHEDFVFNRLLYLLPAFLSVFIFFIWCIIILDKRIHNTEDWQIIISLLAASLGGGLSMLINAKSLNFEEYKTKKYYFMLGIERIILAFMAGAVAFITLKSGFLTSEILNKGYWALMLTLVIAGFSESFIPGVLSKSEGYVSKS